MDDNESALSENGSPRLIAYCMPGHETYLPIVPAQASREWMERDTLGWANRCLPLRIANQHGWCILNDVEFTAVWSGKTNRSGVRIATLGRAKPAFVSSMFGFGVLTWALPYLFRSPPGFNLLFRGPTNTPKDGISPLDGIVECDWLPYPTTFSWKFTRKRKAVTFGAGEPIAMVIPIRRGDIETFAPEIRALESDPELRKRYEAWHESRLKAVDELKGQMIATMEPMKEKQGQYTRGEDHLGEKSLDHQKHIQVRPFAGLETPKLDPSGMEREGTLSIWSRLFRK